MDFVQKIVILFCLVILLDSCSKDMVEEVTCDPDKIVTYESDIKSLMETNCAYAGCHVQGFERGDYSSFSELSKEVGENFLEWITVKDMPPFWATDGPKEMSQLDIYKFQCWAQAGYPEN